MTTVAVKKKDCMVCSAGREVWYAVNEAIWDGRDPSPATRVWGHAGKAEKVLETYGMNGVDRRTIYRHREHVEQGHRVVGEAKPQTTRELTVYATDFQSVTDKMAGLGMQAAELLTQRMASGDIDDKSLVGVAQIGMKAVHSREIVARGDRTPQINIQAIFGVSGGFLKGEVSEYRVIEGSATTVDLKAEVEQKRARLKELQAG